MERALGGCEVWLAQSRHLYGQSGLGYLSGLWKPLRHRACTPSEQTLLSRRSLATEKIIRMGYFAVDSSRNQASYSKPDHPWAAGSTWVQFTIHSGLLWSFLQRWGNQHLHGTHGKCIVISCNLKLLTGCTLNVWVSGVNEVDFLVWVKHLKPFQISNFFSHIHGTLDKIFQNLKILTRSCSSDACSGLGLIFVQYKVSVDQMMLIGMTPVGSLVALITRK